MNRLPHPRALALGALLVAALAAGCGDDEATQPAPEPDHVTAQHVLIGFGNTIPGRPQARTQTQADSLTTWIVQQAIGGESFDSLVARHTNDAYPGIYRLANTGVTPGAGEYARGNFVQGFGDVAFALEIGQIGVARYHAVTSPYGYHVIKRLE